MSKDKLKKCPFCDGIADIYQNVGIFEGVSGWQVRCLKCNSSSCWWHSYQEAIDAWNKRANCERCKELEALLGETIHWLEENEMTIKLGNKIKQAIGKQEDVPKDFDKVFKDNWKKILA